MMRYFLELNRRLGWFGWAWIAILAVGIFVRTYNLHNWLHFGSDQERDAYLVENVVNGTTPWPLLGMEAGNTRFKLGPMHYYFQIVSAKIFGTDPSAMAYPDALFSILALPVFYFLVRRYFRRNMSLALTGLYTVSFYVVEYSRFAWNPNAVPFFTFVFLLSMLKLLEEREKTRWIWVGVLSISIGVGVQLHALLLLLLPVVSCIVFTFLLIKDRNVWRKLAVVIIIALILNIPPIWGDIQARGENSSLFLSAFSDRSQSGGERFSEDLGTNILCHMQMKTHILSSLGDKSNCTFLSTWSRHKGLSGINLYLVYLGIIVSFLFSVIGYGLLGFRIWKESDAQKKQFLGLTALYISLSFVIMFSIIRGAPLRYFIHMTFVPFLLFGLMLEWVRENMSRWYLTLAFLAFALLFGTNLYSIGVETSNLASGMRGSSGFVVLGEADRMVDHMIAQSSPLKEANFSGGTAYFDTYYDSLKYLAEKKHFTLNPVDRKAPPTSDAPYFFMWRNLKSGDTFDIEGYRLVGNKNFGQMGIYQLKKQ